MGALGMIVSFSIGFSIKRGYKAINDLLQDAKEYKQNISLTEPLPPTIGSQCKDRVCLLPGRLLPWIFGIAWVILLVMVALIELPSPKN